MTPASKITYNKPFLSTQEQIEQLKVLGSFLHHLTIIRNICAHHSVLWNKNLTVEFVIPAKDQDKYNIHERRKLFNTFVMSEHLMGIISPRSSWYQRVEKLIERYSIDTAMMGYKS